MVTRYRRVCPNNNNNKSNNNHVSLVERFHPSTLHELRQLCLHANTDAPDTAHQLDDEVVTAEVAYTMTNTQSSCSGEGKSYRIPNTFKEAIGLPMVARWKAASGKETKSLEKHGVFKLV